MPCAHINYLYCRSAIQCFSTEKGDRRLGVARGATKRERRDLIQKASVGANPQPAASGGLNRRADGLCAATKPSPPLGFPTLFPLQCAATVSSRGTPWISSKPSKNRSPTTRCCFT